MIAPEHARYVPDLMDESSQAAVMGALERLYAHSLKRVWPAAYDAKKVGNPIPLSKIDIVVLSLDRIGAPAGASGAQVFFAYFSHRDSRPGDRLSASPPLVVKIGALKKLKAEIDFIKDWPTLREDIRTHFAIPLRLDKIDSNSAVLIAPFRSQFWPADGGIRQDLRHADLWNMLHRPEELRTSNSHDWAEIKRTVGHALDTVDYVHRDNKAQYLRSSSTYKAAYDGYLRGTFAATGTVADRTHIPQRIFGDADQVSAFGRTWPNPSLLINELMSASGEFEGTMGPVHGDLHPKNIVIGHADAVQIIDFGWAGARQHVVVDYLLLDINLRSTTLPSVCRPGWPTRPWSRHSSWPSGIPPIGGQSFRSPNGCPPVNMSKLSCPA